MAIDFYSHSGDQPFRITNGLLTGYPNDDDWNIGGMCVDKDGNVYATTSDHFLVKFNAGLSEWDLGFADPNRTKSGASTYFTWNGKSYLWYNGRPPYIETVYDPASNTIWVNDNFILPGGAPGAHVIYTLAQFSTDGELLKLAQPLDWTRYNGGSGDNDLFSYYHTGTGSIAIDVEGQRIFTTGYASTGPNPVVSYDLAVYHIPTDTFKYSTAAFQQYGNPDVVAPPGSLPVGVYGTVALTWDAQHNWLWAVGSYAQGTRSGNYHRKHAFVAYDPALFTKEGLGYEAAVHYVIFSDLDAPEYTPDVPAYGFVEGMCLLNDGVTMLWSSMNGLHPEGNLYGAAFWATNLETGENTFVVSDLSNPDGPPESASTGMPWSSGYLGNIALPPRVFEKLTVVARGTRVDFA